MEILGLPIWQFFIVVGILLCTAEMFVPGFVVFPVGVGFLIGAVVAVFVQSPVAVYLSLAVSVLVAWWICHKILKVHPNKPRLLSSAERLVGQSCTVSESIGDRSPGRIKISGDIFFALADDKHLAIPAGTEVVILRFEGNKAIVAVKPVA